MKLKEKIGGVLVRLIQKKYVRFYGWLEHLSLILMGWNIAKHNIVGFFVFIFLSAIFGVFCDLSNEAEAEKTERAELLANGTPKEKYV